MNSQLRLLIKIFERPAGLVGCFVRLRARTYCYYTIVRLSKSSSSKRQGRRRYLVFVVVWLHSTAIKLGIRHAFSD
jgi:hypothetical protein